MKTSNDYLVEALNHRRWVEAQTLSPSDRLHQLSLANRLIELAREALREG